MKPLRRAEIAQLSKLSRNHKTTCRADRVHLAEHQRNRIRFLLKILRAATTKMVSITLSYRKPYLILLILPMVVSTRVPCAKVSPTARV